jgi:hypothetical protein
MHEIYLLAVLFNASRRQSAEHTREQRLSGEQAFYELHSGDRGPRFKGFSRFAPAVPAAVVAFAVVFGLAHLLLR